jgi:hypothetical protein
LIETYLCTKDASDAIDVDNIPISESADKVDVDKIQFDNSAAGQLAYNEPSRDSVRLSEFSQSADKGMWVINYMELSKFQHHGVKSQNMELRR